MNYIDKVKRFHETFGHPVEGAPIIPSKETIDLRVSLLQEEVSELKMAAEEGDIVGVADALADIQYVLSGAILCFGLQEKFNEIFQEVQNSNMSKLGEDGKPIYREDGKVLKGPNYFTPEIDKVLSGEKTPPNLD